MNKVCIRVCLIMPCHAAWYLFSNCAYFSNLFHVFIGLLEQIRLLVYERWNMIQYLSAKYHSQKFYFHEFSSTWWAVAYQCSGIMLKTVFSGSDASLLDTWNKLQTHEVKFKIVQWILFTISLTAVFILLLYSWWVETRWSRIQWHNLVAQVGMPIWWSSFLANSVPGSSWDNMLHIINLHMINNSISRLNKGTSMEQLLIAYVGTCSEYDDADNRVVLISRLQLDTLIDQSRLCWLILLLVME